MSTQSFSIEHHICGHGNPWLLICQVAFPCSSAIAVHDSWRLVQCHHHFSKLQHKPSGMSQHALARLDEPRLNAAPKRSPLGDTEFREISAMGYGLPFWCKIRSWDVVALGCVNSSEMRVLIAAKEEESVNSHLTCFAYPYHPPGSTSRVKTLLKSAIC